MPSQVRRRPAVARSRGGRATQARFAGIQRSRLLSAAVRAVDELGYSDTSVGDITSRARVSRRTFYEQFPDREACLAAALEDPRFTPMNVAELDGVEIEISVLSPLSEISPNQIEAGRHGLLVSSRGNRGVLLPQVALEHQWEARRFLEETCVKAGLERDAWKDTQTRIQAFTAEIFSEAESVAGSKPDAHKQSKPGYSTST